MKKSKRIDRIRSLKGIFITLLSLFVLFASSEFVLRTFTSFGDTLNNIEYYASIAFSEEELKTAMKAREDLASIGRRVVGIPGTIIYRYKKARTESFNFNSFGFRGEEPQKKEKNEYRIGLYGDSRILGIYLAEKNTIPFVVQKRLQEEFPDRKITVFNIGIEGTELMREIPFAELESENLELDMALFYSGTGDVNYSFERGNIEHPPFKTEEDVVQGVIENLDADKKKSFFQRSAVVKVIKEAFWSDSAQNMVSFEKEDGFRPLIPEFEARADELVAKLKARMKKASDLLAAKGIKTVFVFSTFLQSKEFWSSTEHNLIYRNEIAVPGLNSYVLRCVEGMSESEDPVIFNHSYVFDGYSDTMFYDGVHFTPTASRIVGNDVAERLIPLLKEYLKQESN